VDEDSSKKGGLLLGGYLSPQNIKERNGDRENWKKEKGRTTTRQGIYQYVSQETSKMQILKIRDFEQKREKKKKDRGILPKEKKGLSLWGKRLRMPGMGAEE